MSVVAELRRVHLLLGATPPVPALVAADLEVQAGEVVGVVGESGSGKSALARCLLRLVRPQSGQVHFEGEDISQWPERRLRPRRARMTAVFKHPVPVLNPGMSVRRLIEEPLLLHTRSSAAERRTAGERMAERVNLTPAELDRLPADLAPARLQLVCLARALVTGPRLVVLDEPTRVLDSAAAADFLGVLAAERAENGTAMVLISDDLAAVRLLADRIAVLHLGHIVELGASADVLRDPLHPYTQALLSAHLAADPQQRGRRIRLRGEAPALDDRPPGCSFAPRCPLVEARCRSGSPTPNQVGADRLVACVRVLEGTSRIPLTR